MFQDPFSLSKIVNPEPVFPTSEIDVLTTEYRGAGHETVSVRTPARSETERERVLNLGKRNLPESAHVDGRHRYKQK